MPMLSRPPFRARGGMPVLASTRLPPTVRSIPDRRKIRPPTRPARP